MTILKKVLLAFGIFASIAAYASSVDEVNKKIVDMLVGFNNPTTKAAIAFTALSTDEVRTLDFGAFGLYSKKGKSNAIVLDVPNVSYKYGDGTQPTAEFHGKLSVDFVKAFSQQTLNEYATEIREIVESLAEEFGKKYGDALVLEIDVKDLVKDAKGDVVSTSVSGTAKIDLSKLPKELKPEDVEFQLVQIELKADRMGLAASGKVILNTKYKGFSPQGYGLKEFIEKLLKGDSSGFQSIFDIAKMVDEFAESIVNK